jgi:hypothetical protein
MLEEEFEKLLNKKWDTEEEQQLIKRIMEGILYYKRFLPKTLKDDVILSLQLCNKLKSELEELKNKTDGEKENKDCYNTTILSNIEKELQLFRLEINDIKMLLKKKKRIKRKNILNKFKFF